MDAQLSRHGRIAVASITGIMKRYAEGRDPKYGEKQAAADVREVLTDRRLLDREVDEVLAASLAFFLGGADWYDEAAKKFLLEFGASLTRAETIRAARAKRRPVAFGDARLGG
jgi:hypothetical protein